MQYLVIIFFSLLAITGFLLLNMMRLPSKVRKAEEYIDEGEFSKASEIIKAILDKKKDYVPARYIRALLYIKQKQYLLAIAELNGILAIPSFDKFVKEVDIHYHLAFLYKETKNYQKEIEEYKLILAFNPDDLTANHRIGHALFKQKDYRKVKEHLTKVTILDPAMRDVYLPLGISCFNISDYEKSEEYLSEALKDPGDHDEIEFHLGLIFKMKKDYDSAIPMFEKTKNSKKFNIQSLYELGGIYFDLNQFTDAIEILEGGLSSLKDKTEEAHSYRYLLAECYELENKIKEAVHHWEKISSENPGYRSTKLKLESYRDILSNDNLLTVFNSSLEELQPLIVELISSLNYNIISKHRVSGNEYQYKAYNIKRINDPPLLIYFNRTTREITEGQIIDFQKKINSEKCKSGIYITTSKFSLRAKSNASSKMIDLYDSTFVNKVVEKIQNRQQKT
jgi:tetratricopeptide (TPR) repeat protein